MPLDLWVMTDKAESPSTRRLLDVAARRGHTAARVPPNEVTVALGTETSAVGCVHGRALPDVVLARMGGGTVRDAFDVPAALEALGVAIVSRAAALIVARDKALTAIALTARGLPIPRTAWIATGRLDDALDVVPGPPWVLKRADGHQGAGVTRIDSLDALRRAVDALGASISRVIVQEHVARAVGSDLRLVVVRGRVVAAMRRTAREGELHANLHRGGTATAVVPEAAFERLAIAAAAAIGLDVAGVDMLEGDAGPLVLEVNASPGLMGIERVTGIDVASAILDAVERRSNER